MPWGRKKALPGETVWKRNSSCSRPSFLWSISAARFCCASSAFERGFDGSPLSSVAEEKDLETHLRDEIPETPLPEVAAVLCGATTLCTDVDVEEKPPRERDGMEEAVVKCAEVREDTETEEDTRGDVSERFDEGDEVLVGRLRRCIAEMRARRYWYRGVCLVVSMCTPCENQQT